MPRLRVTRNSVTGANAAGAAAAPSVPWTPANITTTVWYDAADAATITLNGSAVSQWNDKSGSGFHISQATASQQPSYNATGLNNKGLVTFDGSNDYLFTNAGPAAGATLTTFIAVFKYISASGEDMVLGLGNTGDFGRIRALYRTSGGTTQVYAGWNAELPSSTLSCDIGGDHHIWSVVQSSLSAPQVSLWRDGTTSNGSPETLNGTLQATQSAGFSLGSVKGGSVANYYSNVSVAEVLGFYTAVSTSDRQKLEGYLAHKWGLAASLSSNHPYKVAAPVIPGPAEPAPGDPWTPANITTTVWYDAADASTIALNGSTVSQWNDKSGNNYHATQSNSSSQPTYTASGQSGKAVLTFDGSSDFFVFAPGIVPRTIIAVAKTSVSAVYKTIAGAITTTGATPTDAYYLQFNNPANITAFARATVTDPPGSTNLLSLAGTATIGEYFMLAGKQEGQQITSWFNGVQGSTDTDAGTLKGVGNGVIGAGYYNRAIGDYWQGTIAEVIICANAQADQDIRRLEGYLAHKWGLTANLPSDHPYKTAAPAIP